jgi:hypothetical protein
MKERNLENLRLFLEGTNARFINSVDGEYETYLHRLISTNWIEGASYLLDYLCNDPDSLEYQLCNCRGGCYKESCLERAAREGSMPILQKMLVSLTASPAPWRCLMRVDGSGRHVLHIFCQYLHCAWGCQRRARRSMPAKVDHRSPSLQTVLDAVGTLFQLFKPAPCQLLQFLGQCDMHGFNVCDYILQLRSSVLMSFVLGQIGYMLAKDFSSGLTSEDDLALSKQIFYSASADPVDDVFALVSIRHLKAAILYNQADLVIGMGTFLGNVFDGRNEPHELASILSFAITHHKMNSLNALLSVSVFRQNINCINMTSRRKVLDVALLLAATEATTRTRYGGSVTIDEALVVYHVAAIRTLILHGADPYKKIELSSDTQSHVKPSLDIFAEPLHARLIDMSRELDNCFALGAAVGIVDILRLLNTSDVKCSPIADSYTFRLGPQSFASNPLSLAIVAGRGAQCLEYMLHYTNLKYLINLNDKYGLNPLTLALNCHDVGYLEVLLRHRGVNPHHSLRITDNDNCFQALAGAVIAHVAVEMAVTMDPLALEIHRTGDRKKQEILDVRQHSMSISISMSCLVKTTCHDVACFTSCSLTNSVCPVLFFCCVSDQSIDKSFESVRGYHFRQLHRVCARMTSVRQVTTQIVEIARMIPKKVERGALHRVLLRSMVLMETLKGIARGIASADVVYFGVWDSDGAQCQKLQKLAADFGSDRFRWSDIRDVEASGLLRKFQFWAKQCLALIEIIREDPSSAPTSDLAERLKVCRLQMGHRKQFRDALQRLLQTPKSYVAWTQIASLPSMKRRCDDPVTYALGLVGSWSANPQLWTHLYVPSCRDNVHRFWWWQAVHNHDWNFLLGLVPTILHHEAIEDLELLLLLAAEGGGTDLVLAILRYDWCALHPSF